MVASAGGKGKGATASKHCEHRSTGAKALPRRHAARTTRGCSRILRGRTCAVYAETQTRQKMAKLMLSNLPAADRGSTTPVPMTVEQPSRKYEGAVRKKVWRVQYAFSASLPPKSFGSRSLRVWLSVAQPWSMNHIASAKVSRMTTVHTHVPLVNGLSTTIACSYRDSTGALGITSVTPTLLK